METVDVATKAILMLVLYAVEVWFNIWIWWLIIKAIGKAIKKATTNKFFHNNVVVTNPDLSKKYSDLATLKKGEYIDISKEQLAEFNTEDLETFKNYFYKLFISFENAYNNLDYNMMKTLSTKQLYQNYYTGITLDLEAGNKRIIDNIQKKKVIIYETFTSTAKQVVSAMIEISYTTYMINKNGQIIKGSRDNKITEKFEVTFRKDFEKNEIEKCPNCGANIVGNKCEFCRTNVKNVEFKLSNIKRIIEE